MGRPKSNRICDIDGCNKKHRALGLCHNHWSLLKKNGSPTVKRRADNGCANSISGHGYRRVTGNKYEHIKVVERVLGRTLPKGAQVHHLNGIKTDNRLDNLVLCPSSAYHSLLHQRQSAIDSGFDPSWIKCGYCHEYDDPQNLEPRKRGTRVHRVCSNLYAKKRRILLEAQSV